MRKGGLEMKKWIFVLFLIVIAGALSSAGCFVSKSPNEKAIPFSGGVKEMIEKGIIAVTSDPKSGIISHCKITDIDNKSITVLVQAGKETWYSGVNIPFTNDYAIFIMHTNYKSQVEDELKKYPGLAEQDVVNELVGKCPYKVEKVINEYGIGGKELIAVYFGEQGNIEDIKKEIGDDAEITLQLSGTTIKSVSIDIFSNKP